MEETPVSITRRKFMLASGALAVSATIAGSILPASAQPATTISTGTVDSLPLNRTPHTRPVTLPASNDPVAVSVADTVFWCDQLQEHARFFIMLMPGAELAGQRSQAEAFQRTFSNVMNTAKTAKIDRSNLAAFNRSTIEQVKPFVEYKRRLMALQTSGKLQSLVWPLFFDHTAREAERFSIRLHQLATGDSTLRLDEVRSFWAAIMSEHAMFVAHLLDPKETELFKRSMKLAGAADAAQKTSLPRKAIEAMANEVIDFKTAAEMGIETGKIKSIIHPTLADHVRREAVKFLDEVKRAV